MGNVIESFLSGFAEVAGKLLNSPLQFLAGKSCSSVCGYTWDIFCYIEHFCIANLLKLGTIAALSYIVLLSLYVLYKIGLCGCVGRSLCKMGWACMATYCYACEYICSFLCHKLHRIRQQRKQDLELVYISSSTSEEEERSSPRCFHKHVEGKRSRSRRWRKEHLRRSLRPRSHRIRVGISGDSVMLIREIVLRFVMILECLKPQDLLKKVVVLRDRCIEEESYEGFTRMQTFVYHTFSTS